MVIKKPLVQKYGGATLATPEKIKQVARRISHLAEQKIPLVVAVSAMGQTTNQLIELAHQVSDRPTLREMDMLLTTGERISTALMSMALNDLGVPAVSLTGSQAGIITDESHFNAHILEIRAHRVLENLQAGKVVVLAGFQGVSERSKEITTLGRGGTDTTAIAMAHFLGAERCEILKDVPSIFSADPKLVPEARPLSEISYEQLYDMTMWGAKVLHYRSVELALKHKVPLYVGPAAEENSQGTWIRHSQNQSPAPSDRLLAVNSHHWVLEIAGCESTKSLLGFLREKQIPEPHLIQMPEDQSDGKIWLTGPNEVILAIQKEISMEPNSPNSWSRSPTNWCSVTGTCSGLMPASLLEKARKELFTHSVEVKKIWSSDHGFTAIVPQSQHLAAVRALHHLT